MKHVPGKDEDEDTTVENCSNRLHVDYVCQCITFFTFPNVIIISSLSLFIFGNVSLSFISIYQQFPQPYNVPSPSEGPL